MKLSADHVAQLEACTKKQFETNYSLQLILTTTYFTYLGPTTHYLLPTTYDLQTTIDNLHLTTTYELRTDKEIRFNY